MAQFTAFVNARTYEGPDFPISKFTILRKPEEYAKQFKPYRLVKQKTVKCAGDTFTMMLFEKPGEESSHHNRDNETGTDPNSSLQDTGLLDIAKTQTHIASLSHKMY